MTQLKIRMTWFYKDTPFDAALADGHIGFVYVITRLDTGKKYIGQKKFGRKQTRAPLKGKKRKRVSVVESDWQDYWSSNKTLQNEVETIGKENFRRDILWLCKSKGELNYRELKEQMLVDAVLRPAAYYNEYCGGRIARKQLQRLIDSLDSH